MERVNMNYEDEVTKAHEKLFPRKKRIAHNCPVSDISDNVFDQQNLENFGELFGVQNIDFEKVQPRSKSYYAQKMKSKSFPLLKKSQRHLKYIRHNVYSASKQRAHVSSVGTNESSRSPDSFSRIHELEDTFPTSSLESTDFNSKIKQTEGFYQQGIAEIVKSRGRLKYTTDKNINTSCSSDNSKKKDSEFHKKNLHQKNSNCNDFSFETNGDKSNYKDKIKTKHKYKDKSNKHHQCKDNSSDYKESNNYKNYNCNSSENKHGSKCKEKSNKKCKSQLNINQLNTTKYQTVNNKCKLDKNPLLKKKKHKHKRKVDLLEDSCQDSINIANMIKTQPCCVVIEECPEISHLLSSNSKTMKTDSQNRPLNVTPHSSHVVEDISRSNSSSVFFEARQFTQNTSADGPEKNIDSSDSSDKELVLPIPSLENFTYSSDEVMVIDEPSNNCNVKIKQIFSTPTWKVKQESGVSELKAFSEKISKAEEKIVSLPEVIDLSDDDSELEILEVKIDKSSLSSGSELKHFDKNNLNDISKSVEQLPDKLKSEVCQNDFKMLQESVKDILSENSTSRFNKHLNVVVSDTLSLNQMKSDIKPLLFNTDKIKIENIVKYEDIEDEINESSISKILNFDGVQPTISPLIDLFERESQDLKNVQCAVKSYSNVAAGLKMLEQEKIKRLKYMACALKKFKESKKKFDEKVDICPGNLFMQDMNNIKLTEPSMNGLNEDLKTDKKHGIQSIDLPNIPIFNEEKVLNSLSKPEKVCETFSKSVPTASNFPAAFNSLNSTHSLTEPEKSISLNKCNSLNKTVPPCNSYVNSICCSANEIGSNSRVLKTYHSSEKQSIFSEAVYSKGISHVAKSQESDCSISKPLPHVSTNNFIPLNPHSMLPSISMTQQPEKAFLLQKSSKGTVIDGIGKNHLQQERSKVTTPVGRFCEVCGKRAVFACQGCSKVFFCSNECGEKFWTSGHNEVC